MKASHISKLKSLGESFEERIFTVISGQDVYGRLYEEEFRQSLDAVENEILLTTLKYYAILEEHKRLSVVKYEHVKEAINIKRDIEDLNKKLQEFAAVLQFETWGAVRLTKLDDYNPQLSRCEKALMDNMKTVFFQGTHFSSLKLCHAFKIENQINLKPFEKTLKESENTLLKGMFLSVSKKQLYDLILFGARTSEYTQTQGIQDLREKYLRLPEIYARKNKTESFLKASKGLASTIYLSTNSTLERDQEKLSKASNCVIYLVLCRVILPKNKQEAGFDARTQEFKISDYNSIYPEYVLICTKQKSYFEVVSEKSMIIPAKLTDLSYFNAFSSNKMTAEVFHSTVIKAIDQSQVQRKKLKADLNNSLDNFWSNIKLNSCKYRAIESRNVFIDKLRLKNESLKRELLNVQRFNEALRKIAKIRSK